MKRADALVTLYRRLRGQPLWRLLSSDNGPAVIGILQATLSEGERTLSASIFFDRVERELEQLRARGEDLPQNAQGYAADWLKQGFLERRFPGGAAEEQYELSVASAEAIRFLSTIIGGRPTATESRLAAVIQQIVRLAEESDPNPKTRIKALIAERERIDREIEAIRKGHAKPLTDERAIERTREIIRLAEELAGDFLRVRDQFEHLNRDFREKILDEEGSRGEVLGALFAGVDLIADSEAGRTFAAFWRLLTDPEQSASLDDAIDQVLERSFAAKLPHAERQFLRRLTRTLLDQGGAVHEVLQHFARSLKHFVQSREYLEQRRLSQLLREAQRVALSLKDEAKSTDIVSYTLQLTTSRLRSLSQWALYDPSTSAPPPKMTEADAPAIDLDRVGKLIEQSEIDFRSLKLAIRAVLRTQAQASIGEIMDRFPVKQGLGSVVGYLALGSQHGVQFNRHEVVSWQNEDQAERRARIPKIVFLKERLNELA